MIFCTFMKGRKSAVNRVENCGEGVENRVLRNSNARQNRVNAILFIKDANFYAGNAEKLRGNSFKLEYTCRP